MLIHKGVFTDEQTDEKNRERERKKERKLSDKPNVGNESMRCLFKFEFQVNNEEIFSLNMS